MAQKSTLRAVKQITFGAVCVLGYLVPLQLSTRFELLSTRISWRLSSSVPLMSVLHPENAVVTAALHRLSSRTLPYAIVSGAVSIVKPESVEAYSESLLQGTPWDGCDDLIQEDMNCWLQDCQEVWSQQSPPCAALWQLPGLIDTSRFNAWKSPELLPSPCPSGGLSMCSTEATVSDRLQPALPCSQEVSIGANIAEVWPPANTGLPNPASSAGDWERQFMLQGLIEELGRSLDDA